MFSAETSLIKGKPEDIAIVEAIAVFPEPGGPIKNLNELPGQFRKDEMTHREGEQKREEFAQMFVLVQPVACHLARYPIRVEPHQSRHGSRRETRRRGTNVNMVIKVDDTVLNNLL